MALFHGTRAVVAGGARAPSWEGQQLVVVGPGWLGSALAATLANAGARVWTVQRSEPATTTTGVTALQGDVRAGADAPWTAALPNRLDHVVVCVAPGRQASDGYAETYPSAVLAAKAIARARGARTVLYTSSTGVYGRTDGGTSRETDAIVPRDARQQALMDAEAPLLGNGAPDDPVGIVLRVAGLYGPGRDPGARYRAATTAGDAAMLDGWTNLAWRDDVIGAIQHLLTLRDSRPFAPGSGHCFNCADGASMRVRDIAWALGADHLNTTPSSPARPAAQSGRSNQRVMVEALRATGWTPSMPTVLHGLAALGHPIRWPPDQLAVPQAGRDA